MTQALIRNVSDTARWVAAYRARESARPDALFHDPLAGRLAGEHGQRIATAMQERAAMGDGWPIVVRTKIIDEYVDSALAGGCDAVLNLAAGLDTRPYRLDLPPSLPWIEADLPEMIELKEGELSGETPHCAVERHGIDLSDASARARLFDEVARNRRRVLVISEGLLVYLDPREVSALSDDLAARASLHSWVTDLASPGILKRMRRSSRAAGGLANAPMTFGPDNGIAFFEALGWRVAEGRSLLREAARLMRVPWFMRLAARLPEANPRRPGNRPWSWVMRLERAGGPPSS